MQGKSGVAATLQTLVSKLLILAVNVATGIITARVLGPEGRGEQAAISMWPSLLAYSLTFGLPAALLYNLKRYPEEKTELFSASLVLGTGLSLMATIIGVVFIPLWLVKYSPEVIFYAQLLMLTAPLALLGVTFSAALEASDDFTRANQLYFFPPLCTLFALVVLALLGKLTALTSALSYMLSGVPIFIWTFVRLWRLFQPRWTGLAASFKRLLNFGLRSYGIDLLSTLGSQIGDVLIVGLLAPELMGLYTVAVSVSRMLSVLESSIATVLFPKAAARPVQEVVALTGRAARVSLVITLLVGLAVMVIGPFLLQLLYGSKYMGAVPVFRILIIEVVLGGATAILAQAFMALGRPSIVTILQAVGLGMSVPLMLILIPKFGLVGVGLAVLGSTTARLISVIVSYQLVLKVQPPRLLFTWDDWNFIKQKFQ